MRIQMQMRHADIDRKNRRIEVENERRRIEIENHRIEIKKWTMSAVKLRCNMNLN